jgi:hypothetical protein
MNPFRSAVGVGERPLHRALAELAIVRRYVRAPTVLEVAGDGVVVVAVDGRDAPVLDQRAHVVRMRAVPDQVAAAVDGVDADVLDGREGRLQSRLVRVDVRDHRDAHR